MWVMKDFTLPTLRCELKPDIFPPLNYVASTFQNIFPLISNHLGRVLGIVTLSVYVYYCGVVLNRRRVVFV